MVKGEKKINVGLVHKFQMISNNSSLPPHPTPLLDFQFRLKVGKSSWDQRKTIRRSGIVLLQGRQVKRESENVTTTDTLGRISTEMTRKYNCHCPSSVLFSFLLVPSCLPTGQKAQAQKLKAKK